jgi:hypothetical protein
VILAIWLHETWALKDWYLGEYYNSHNHWLVCRTGEVSSPGLPFTRLFVIENVETTC